MKFFINLFVFILIFPSVSLSAVESTPQKNPSDFQNQNSQTTDINIEKNCDNLYKNLRTCAEYKCSTLKPDDSGEVVKHSITGLQQNICVHYQSWDGNDILTCRYNEDSRKFVASMLEKQSQGYTPTEDEFTIMQQIFKTECEVKEFNFFEDGKTVSN
jgi:hypothetical protein